MNIVYKYCLEPFATRLSLPPGSKVLHIAAQNDVPHVWVQHSTALEPAPRPLVIRTVPTGGSVDPSWTYLGTVLLAGGSLVFHFYQEP